jgi:hypothetical protein
MLQYDALRNTGTARWENYKAHAIRRCRKLIVNVAGREPGDGVFIYYEGCNGSFLKNLGHLAANSTRESLVKSMRCNNRSIGKSGLSPTGAAPALRMARMATTVQEDLWKRKGTIASLLS